MKHRLVRVVCALSLMFITGWGLRAVPSIYPTGTTVFDPDRTWSGYTIFATPDSQGTVLVDMNGTLVKRWTQIASVPSPVRILPGVSSWAGVRSGSLIRSRSHWCNLIGKATRCGGSTVLKK